MAASNVATSPTSPVLEALEAFTGQRVSTPQAHVAELPLAPVRTLHGHPQGRPDFEYPVGAKRKVGPTRFYGYALQADRGA